MGDKLDRFLNIFKWRTLAIKLFLSGLLLADSEVRRILCSILQNENIESQNISDISDKYQIGWQMIIKGHLELEWKIMATGPLFESVFLACSA